MDNSNGFMYKLSEFIVDKRKGFFILFIIAFLFCLTSISKVGVEDDLAEYLPETTETRIGVDIMEDEFTTFGTAYVLITNITLDRAYIIADGLENIDGIDSVDFYDPEEAEKNDKVLEDYYKDSSALMRLHFEEEEDTELSQKAIAEVRQYVSGYDNYVYTTVDKDDSAELINEIKFILVIVAIVILGVLIFTSKTYMEIPIFVATFVMAAVLNKGTNFIFGTISYISNAVDAILQLALAIDYAIILFHRYMEEKDMGQDSREAMIQALSKGIVEISSSSLTTVSGMVALLFMQYGIGKDLGLVLIKAILFSMITVFLFMPSLIMMGANKIDKTRHKNFVPEINIYGKILFKLRFILPLVFFAVIGFGIYYSGKCPYIFDNTTPDSRLKTDYIKAKERIEETFELGNVMAIVLPVGDYEKEAAIIKELKQEDFVNEVSALANTEVGDSGDYQLTDEVTPRQFAEIAEIDVGLSKLLYTAYAQDNEAYGAFIDGIDTYKVSILNLIDYIYEQKEKGAINLSDKQSEDLDDIHKAVDDGRKQTESETHSRIIFIMNGKPEGQETFNNIDHVRDIAQKYYKEKIYVVGNPTSNYDLSRSFSHDNTLISVLTALFVGIILLFTFQSAGLPFVLLLTIQGSIWINFSIPYLTNKGMFFLCYLIVSSIQMGATIDYAIVITNRYLALRKELPSKRDAVIKSLNESFPTVLTSGSIMSVCGGLIGNMTSNAVIAQLGIALCRGTITSIILVMSVLPLLLYFFDPLIDKTSFEISTNVQGVGNPLKGKAYNYVNGTVRGYFNGYLTGSFNGIMDGDMDLGLIRGEASPEKDDSGEINTYDDYKEDEESYQQDEENTELSEAGSVKDEGGEDDE
ncbi:MAG: MMPL family transporter [Lachnospiraceae bacterium]|nr:MMPL family transporter [Lachnospiraceae bacterium]